MSLLRNTICTQAAEDVATYIFEQHGVEVDVADLKLLIDYQVGEFVDICEEHDMVANFDEEG
jgi:hypothetical protein